MCEFISWGRGREGTIVWEELHGLGDALQSCGWDVDTVTAVVLGGWSEVPAIYAVGCPRGALFTCRVDLDLGSRWC